MPRSQPAQKRLTDTTMNQEPTSTRAERRHWLFSIFANRNYRIVLLVLVVMLELFAIGFIRTHSWDSLVLILVSAAASSPLLLALLLLAQRRFNLSTMLFVLALVCVFLAVIVLPIRRERNLRIAAHQFEKLGVQARAESYWYKPDLPSLPAKQSPAWLKRLALVSSDLIDSEIRQVAFTTQEQVLGSVDYLSRCRNLKEIFVVNSIPNSSLRMLTQHLRDLDIRAFGIQAGAGAVNGPDLSALDRGPLEKLSIIHQDALASLAEVELLNLKSLTIGNIVAIGNSQAWEQFLGSANMSNVTSLGLHNCQMGDDEASKLAELSSLESLSIYGDRSLAEMGFVAQLPNLESLVLSAVRINDHSLTQLANATQLKSLYLGVSRTRFSNEALQRLKQSLPDCEISVLSKGRIEILQ